MASGRFLRLGEVPIASGGGGAGQGGCRGEGGTAAGVVEVEAWHSGWISPPAGTIIGVVGEAEIGGPPPMVFGGVVAGGGW